MKETKGVVKARKPTWWGLSAYIAVIVVLGLAAIFAPELARLVKGPVLCIYVGVLPKYILGLAFILAGIDGIVYGIGIYRRIDWLGAAASALQTVLMVVFIFLIFPLSLKEGVPPGATYNLMRLLLGLMLIIVAWDMVSEIRGFVRSGKPASEEQKDTDKD
ncbi:MAG TPA: hypothetical protein PLH18_03585 [Clostridia bacterium]|nr:hypothetical protein [Clostridia bacterium]HRX41793.1 hypothetical protein [Clostridia bacterium]